MPYAIGFDFDCSDEPPKQLIYHTDDGTQLADIFEEPICLSKDWSFAPEAWKPGPFAQKIIDLLNKEE